MLNKDLTIITVTYNSEAVISQFLREVAGKFRVIVVDNASKDETVEIVENTYPEVELIKSSKNLGYGNAANMALEQVKTDYTFLLNPDIISDYVEITKLLEVAKLYSEACITAPVTERSLYRKSGDNNIHSVEWVIGAAMLFNMKNLRKTGFFDENIFLYYEETDLCKRILHMNYKILLCDSVLLEHLVGKSSGFNEKTEHLKYWHSAWSELYFIRKYSSKIKYYSKSLLIYFKYLSKFIFYNFSQKRGKRLKYKARLAGFIGFVSGKKAFDENGSPRGI